MKLYEFPPTRSIRVRWILQELGVDFEPVRVTLPAGEHRRADFLAINPAGKVPALIDGDLVLTESAAIALYLGEKYADKGLLPGDLDARAQVYRWMLFAVTELEQPLWRITRHTRLYPEDKRLPADIALAREDFRSMVPVLDAQLRANEFVAGDRFSVADPVVAYTLDWANLLQLLDDFPRVTDYMEAMYSRPAAAPRIMEAFARLEANA
ncbi:MAG TPA: glutathione S-transferase family protein [Gammaproteobacteria bacterium]|nr:glutathione S-transferase family protein [Gammaproteobacteria bacterium]